MRFHIGTSGYAYAEWKGKFYPDKTRSADMLPFYATQFGAVEEIRSPFPWTMLLVKVD